MKEFLKNYEAQIRAEFDRLTARFPALTEEVRKDLFGMDRAHGLALQYLYDTMPLSDLAAYPVSVLRSFSDPAVDLWMQSGQVQEIPEEIWLPYVLSHRVNEEEIRPCRAFFAEQLLPRIAGKTPYDAIVEANYWCAEQGTYHGTDRRTISPMAFYTCGSGRCGEESAFCVSALRAAGIPARQVYVPRWAHCDDNHAWVEAWCDGQWFFLGACEPLLTLNRGWFPPAASRVMIVHSRFFCPEGCSLIPEEKDADVIGREGGVLVLNQTARYADTVRFHIHAEDAAGNPAAGARIRLQILNAAEIADLAQLSADDAGDASVTLGKGSVRVLVSDGARESTVLADSGRDGRICVQLPSSGTCGEADTTGETDARWTSMIFRAPEETPKWPQGVPDETRRQEKEKLEQASAVRLARTGHYENPERARFLEEEVCTAGDSWKVEETAWKERLLAHLSDKDQKDFRADVLASHLRAAMAVRDLSLDEETFAAYVLNPRISSEVLTPWREACAGVFGGDSAYRRSPAEIWQWIGAHIRDLPGRERASVITPPDAVLRSGFGSALSRKVLFAAACRSIGIPARLSPLDEAPEYLVGGVWKTADPADERDAMLRIDAGTEGRKGYYVSWTAARAERGEEHTLDLPAAEVLETGDGILTVPVPHGVYRLYTTLRLPNGTQKAEMAEIAVKPQARRLCRLRFAEAELSEMTVDCMLPDFPLQRTDPADSEIRLSEVTRDGTKILFWLDAAKEPTEHIFNELHESRASFAAVQKSLVFILKSEDDRKDPLVARALAEFPDAVTVTDEGASGAEPCARAVYVNPEALPLIILTDGACHAVFARAGYSVGTAALLLRVLAMLRTPKQK